MRLRIFIDGACRGNPGPGSLGVYIEDEQGRELKRHGRALGRTTNNAAEYAALSEALDLAKSLGGADLEIFSDSELLVRQYRGDYKVKNEHLQAALASIRAKTRGFRSVELTHVRRELNKEADRLANQALDGTLPSGL